MIYSFLSVWMEINIFAGSHVVTHNCPPQVLDRTHIYIYIYIYTYTGSHALRQLPQSKFFHRKADNAGSHVVRHKRLTTRSITGPTLSGSHVDKPTSSITGKFAHSRKPWGDAQRPHHQVLNRCIYTHKFVLNKSS